MLLCGGILYQQLMHVRIVCMKCSRNNVT